MRDPEILKFTLNEVSRLDKIEKEERLLSNPKTKIYGYLLKAARIKSE